ncbi:MAG TPA: T9SS type A sorting domain-containing protein [Bacteroidales bacterium]|nr:T9SS type A sorting domain-containing protein [Bacteroidales bacterium]
MKKITLLLFSFILLVGTANAQTLAELLDRLAVAANNNLGQEPANLFTVDEQSMLQEYFEATYPATTFDNRATGDVYAVQIYGGCDPRGFGYFPLAGPFNMSMISSTHTVFYAGDQDGAGNLFGFAVEGFIDEVVTLVKINTETGEETTIDTLDIYAQESHMPTGMAWNYANNTMYAISSNSDQTRLYTVDLETGALTLIGETGNPKGIWLAIDNSGNAFIVDVGTDYLYSVNLETGAGTPIGPIGTNISFGQDADFDPESGILYTIGYHGGGSNRLYSVNTATGLYTSLGAVNNDCGQFGLVSIQGEPVGIVENFVQGFSFYPNPATGIVNLKSVENIGTVSIYDLLGQRVIESRVDGTDAQLDISALSKGTYILKTDVNGELRTSKLIKN